MPGQHGWVKADRSALAFSGRVEAAPKDYLNKSQQNKRIRIYVRENSINRVILIILYGKIITSTTIFHSQIIGFR